MGRNIFHKAKPRAIVMLSCKIEGRYKNNMRKEQYNFAVGLYASKKQKTINPKQKMAVIPPI